jgi:hypothetical protein
MLRYVIRLFLFLNEKIQFMVGTSSWKQQFAEAVSIDPINDEDEIDGDVEKESQFIR